MASVASTAENAISTEVQHKFMRGALREAMQAIAEGEVPVGCVFVRNPGNGTDAYIIARGSNKTNKFRNATKHAELVAIHDVIMCQECDPSVFRECDLYVTCEPCIMCAAALGKLGIRKVFFGCKNDRFGGNGSLLSVHDRCIVGDASMLPYEVHSGVLEEQAVELFQRFYAMENTRAPVSKRRKKEGQGFELVENSVGEVTDSSANY